MQLSNSIDLHSLRSFVRKHARFLFCLAASLICGLAAHGYFYTGTGFSQDSLMLYTNDVNWQISLGRFMIPVYYYLRGRYTVPWLLGLYTILYTAVSASLIAGMMNIRKGWQLFLLCGILITNAAVTAQTATYVHVIDIYMLGFLTATLAVWLMWRFRFGFLLGIPVLMVSVGLYPAYFAAAATLCVLLVIRSLLWPEVSTKQVWLLIAKALGMLLAGLLLYAAFVQLSLRLSGITLSQSYNGISGVGDYSSVNVPDLLIRLYKYVIRFLKLPTANAPQLIKWCNVFMGLAAFVQLLRLVLLQKPAWWRIALTGAALVLLPLAANITFFLSKGMLHGVMTMPLYLLYLFVLLMPIWYEEAKAASPVRPPKERPWLCHLAVMLIPMLLCVWLVDNVQFANASHLKKRLEAQSTQSVMTRLLDRIEQTEDYLPGETQVVLLGDWNLNQHLTPSRPDFEALKLTGDRVPGYEYEYTVSYPWSYRYYFTYYMGYPIQLASDGIIAQIGASEAAAAMPSFPAAGCIQWIDGYLVVKLSDTSY